MTSFQEKLPIVDCFMCATVLFVGCSAIENHKSFTHKKMQRTNHIMHFLQLLIYLHYSEEFCMSNGLMKLTCHAGHDVR